MTTDTTGFSDHLNYLQTITPGEAGDDKRIELAGFPGLGPFLRALLVADGTVTYLLAAYFDEQIAVKTLGQSMQQIPHDLSLLGLRVGQDVFFRRVVLRGAETGNAYAEAASLINPGRLPASLFNELISEHVGMGEVLRNSARGSYREVMDIRALSEQTMRRTYGVFLEQQPAILITEDFNKSLFE